MALKKIQFQPGVNRENTRYAAEGGWYETDKVRFRQDMPEKIGGWERISSNTFLGVCRSMTGWVTLSSENLLSIGTNLKYYIERGGAYSDVTPIRATTAAGDVTFAAVDGSSILTVTDTGHGALVNDFVTFSGAASLGGNITADVLNQEYQIASVIDADEYTVVAKDTSGVTVTANSSDVGNGGASTVGAYQINTGNATAVPISGFGAGGYGLGPYGVGGTTVQRMRLWSQSNFGEDLFFAARGTAPFYWDASAGLSTRAVYVSSLGGASDVPTVVNFVLVSDIARFAFAFGSNPIGSATLDPMLIRWSDQEDIADWTPEPTNQAGSLRLSRGSEIITAIQGRQEVLVWTDAALYSLQYLGAPDGWGAQLLGDNLSITSANAVAYTGNAAVWMGLDTFYIYDGTVRPLSSTVETYVFTNINRQQYEQVIAGTNSRFNEVWWFYCSEGSNTVDRYVVYNYVDNLWYYGNMARTAWTETGIRAYPQAATYSYNVVSHEVGTDDNETGTPAAIHAEVTSAEFDLEDGDHVMLVTRVLPDVTFVGSSATAPSLTMTLLPLVNAGSGYTSPGSVGGTAVSTATRTATVPIQEFTGQTYVRVRGRQLAVKYESDALGVAWQVGAVRLDMVPDGRRA